MFVTQIVHFNTFLGMCNELLLDVYVASQCAPCIASFSVCCIHSIGLLFVSFIFPLSWLWSFFLLFISN